MFAVLWPLKQSMMGMCALCGLERDLKNSHIIPEFFYRLLYDLHPRRFRVVSTDPSIRDEFEQKGLREHLLCGTCEGKLGRWEDYAKKAFVSAHGVRVRRNRDGWVFDGIDYGVFKLFLLSMLWRMGVSNQKFYRAVELGPHGEKLRAALSNDTPLLPENYACLLIAVRIGQRLNASWMTEPAQGRFEEHRCYFVVISGVLYIFFVGSHPPPASVNPFILNRSGQLEVLDKRLQELPFLSSEILRLREAMNERKKPGAMPCG